MNVEIYTKNYCPYCHRAKALLDQKGIAYREYDVTFDSGKEAEMRNRSGGFTVPQIFFDNELIGGHDDLYTLAHRGELDMLMNVSAATGAVFIG